MVKKRKKNPKLVDSDKIKQGQNTMDNSALNAELQALATKFEGTITGTFTPDVTTVDSFNFTSAPSVPVVVVKPVAGDKTLARMTMLLADKAAGAITPDETVELAALQANPPTV